MSATLQTKTEHKLYVPGKYYRVPTVQAFWREKWGIWVIHGPWHEDADVIGFRDHHYHLHPQFNKSIHVWLMFAYPLHNYPEDSSVKQAKGTSLEVGPVVMRRRKCVREMPAYPARPPWLPRLKQAMRDRQLRMNPHTRICPHRGADLSHVPERDGCVQCPLHGLTWSIETGECEVPQ